MSRLSRALAVAAIVVVSTDANAAKRKEPAQPSPWRQIATGAWIYHLPRRIDHDTIDVHVRVRELAKRGRVNAAIYRVDCVDEAMQMLTMNGEVLDEQPRRYPAPGTVGYALLDASCAMWRQR